MFKWFKKNQTKDDDGKDTEDKSNIENEVEPSDEEASSSSKTSDKNKEEDEKESETKSSETPSQGSKKDSDKKSSEQKSDDGEKDSEVKSDDYEEKPDDEDEKSNDDEEKPDDNKEKPDDDDEKQGVMSSSAKKSDDSEEEEAKGKGELESIAVDIEQGDSAKSFTICEVIDIAGYGKFQKLLTFLAGLGWFADAFEIIILSILGDFLACDWEMYRWQNGLLTSTVFIGMMIGAPTFGMIADNFGRKTSLAISMLVLFAFGAGSALSPNFLTMTLIRTVMGFGLGGVAQGVTLCSEYYPTKLRGTAGFYLTYYWAIGTMVLILVTWLIMWLTESWKWLLFAASLPSLVVFMVMKWYPESARYYLVSGQYDRAVKQLEQVVHMNGAEMPEGRLKRVEEEDMEKRGSVWDLLRKEHRTSTLMFWYIWLSVAFAYYGIALISPIIIKNGHFIVSSEERAEAMGNNATSSADFMVSQIPCKKLTTDNYIDLLWTSAAEFPGLAFFTVMVNCCSRKVLLSSTCISMSLLTLMLLINTDKKIILNIILFIARALAIGIFQLIFIMTAETFPTTLRAIAMGTGSAFARLGGALVPFVTQVLVISSPIATIGIISGVTIFAGIFAAFLPKETKGKHMKELTQSRTESGIEVQQ